MRNTPNTSIVAILIMMIFCESLNGQNQQLTDEGIEKDSNYAIADMLPNADVLKEHSFGSYELDGDDFNQGDIADPLLLMQGRVPGLQVYNRGNNPNSTAYARVRGVTTFNHAVQPLIIIDGMVGASLTMVDPADIKSIRVEKAAALTAQYGVQGSAGVIHIETKSASEGFSVDYRGQRAQASAAHSVTPRGRDAFVERGGFDLGANTDWLGTISQSGVSDNHNLAIGYGSKHMAVRVATNYRSVIGVLKSSGFDQLNNRLDIRANAWDNRLRLHVHGANTTRTSDLGFEEAVRAALVHNPTDPVRAVDAPFPFDGDRYGGFFESLGLFDAFNPLAMLTLNTSQTQLSSYLYGAHAELDISDRLSAAVYVGSQMVTTTRNDIYSTKSLFRGQAASPTSRGAVWYDYHGSDMKYLQPSIKYSQDMANSNLSFTLGYAYQSADDLIASARLADFEAGELAGFEVVGFQRGSAFDSEKLQSSSDLGSNSTNAAFYAAGDFSYGDRFSLTARLRREGSSRVGANEQWTNFYGLNVSYDLGSLMGMDGQSLQVHGAYGRSGMIPTEAGWSKAQFRQVVSGSMDTTSVLARLGNDNLGYELTDEINLGFSFGNDRVGFSLELYNRKSKNLISEEFDSDAFVPFYQNSSAITSSGLDMNLEVAHVASRHTSWTSMLNVSLYRNTIQTLPFEPQRAGYTAPPFSISVTHVEREGGSVGDFFGPRFIGLDPDGVSIFADLNENGTMEIPRVTGNLVGSDAEVIGNGLPSMEIGMAQYLTMGRWTLAARLRGAIGHSLFNVYDLIYGNNELIVENKNGPVTDASEPVAKFIEYSSASLQRADFLTLDNITLGYRLALTKGKHTRYITAAVTAQHIFTWTGYSGFTAEPVLVNYPDSANGSERAIESYSLSAAGTDHLAQYLPSRRLVFSLRLEL